jgi:hypothetical protein
MGCNANAASAACLEQRSGESVEMGETVRMLRWDRVSGRESVDRPAVPLILEAQQLFGTCASEGGFRGTSSAGSTVEPGARGGGGGVESVTELDIESLAEDDIEVSWMCVCVCVHVCVRVVRTVAFSRTRART